MKNIRSKVVRESLLDYNTLAKSLQENTEGAVKNLVSETVRDTYAKLLSEDFDKDYEEDDVDMDGEVEDTADAGGADDVEGDAGAEDGSDGIDAGMDADADAKGGEGIPAEGGEEPAEGQAGPSAFIHHADVDQFLPAHHRPEGDPDPHRGQSCLLSVPQRGDRHDL